ncbi:hypothetical protein L207DRAFT_375940, partial [Hyaloscypha variabilis F]
FQPFTKAERIQQLNDIDKSITELLKSAGLALKALSASQYTPDTPIDDRKKDFQSASGAYLSTLQTLDVNLRRQILGLEEADILPADKGKKDKQVNEFGKTAPAAEATIADGGMGKLDIGWLNSRSGRVERDMEAELWEKAKTFLERLEKGKSNG